ncbi:hypothetical protein [Kaarinaea lacus]
MNRQIKLYILLALLSLVMAAPAMAGDWYIGAKTGRVVVNESVVKTHPTNVGVVLGFEQGLVVGDVGIEAELTSTTSKGKVDGGSEFKTDTKAVYVAFRTAGPMYFKAKGGYLQIDNDDWETKSGASYGIGFGLGLGLVQLELEVTKSMVDPDITFASVGVQF